MKLDRLHGIITALVTPFDRKGHVNTTALREIVQHNLAMGVAGFYVNGTTGEGLLLASDERKQVVETVKDEVQDGAGIVVNISHMEFAVALDLADHARAADAEAVSTLPPLYFPLESDEVAQYYKALLDRVEMDLTVYNIPSLSNIALDESTVSHLAEHPRFLGVKHSSQDLNSIQRFKQIDSGRLTVWSGCDNCFLGGLAMGADGGIGSSFNLMADIFVRILQDFRAGDLEHALKVQSLANRVHSRLQRYGPVKSIKRCLSFVGIDASNCRMPYQPLNGEADAHLRESLELLSDARQQIQTKVSYAQHVR